MFVSGEDMGESNMMSAKTEVAKCQACHCSGAFLLGNKKGDKMSFECCQQTAGELRHFSLRLSHQWVLFPKLKIL